jgi:hypothetical protein
MVFLFIHAPVGFGDFSIEMYDEEGNDAFLAHTLYCVNYSPNFSGLARLQKSKTTAGKFSYFLGTSMAESLEIRNRIRRGGINAL